jgi:hypothetical protein
MDKGYFNNFRTYMVGSDGGRDDKFFNDAYPMRGYKNGGTISDRLQPGDLEPDYPTD